jgi:hypothetical protein
MVAMPSARVYESHQEISSRCEQYGKERAAELLASGKIMDLSELQSDIDACKSKLDNGRQILQVLLLTSGLCVAGYVGMRLWK